MRIGSFNDIFRHIENEETFLLQVVAESHAPIHIQERKTQRSTLCAAAKTGNTASLVHLLKAKANVLMQDNAGNSALHHAAGLGDLEMVNQLIAASANVNVQNDEGHTTLSVALWKKYEILFV